MDTLALPDSNQLYVVVGGRAAASRLLELAAHLAAAAYAADLLPMETFMLSMLLEEHKEVIRLRHQVEVLLAHFPDG